MDSLNDAPVLVDDVCRLYSDHVLGGRASVLIAEASDDRETRRLTVGK
jgi:hypothetical protein